MISAAARIITCAITGSIHTPSMSPFLPITPEQIVRSGLGAAEAGAAILHLHVRDPDTGAPSHDPELFDRVVSALRERTDAVLSITTGGSARMSVDERLAAPLRIGPELCSLNLGSMNFALHPMARRPRTWLHDWEKPFLDASRDGIFRNTFADMERIIGTLSDRFGTRFEFEAYDIGHLYSLAFLMEEGIVRGRPFVQFVLGILGGIGADSHALTMMQDTATRLFGDGIAWSVLPAGRAQMSLGSLAAERGGHVRVGLEDNLWLERGRLAESNAEHVQAMRGHFADLGLHPASPEDARQILGLSL